MRCVAVCQDELVIRMLDEILLPGFEVQFIVETKCEHHAGEMDRALWALGVRPSRVSKYCTSLAALNPDLPSNRWARTLRRHLDSPIEAALAA